MEPLARRGRKSTENLDEMDPKNNGTVQLILKRNLWEKTELASSVCYQSSVRRFRLSGFSTVIWTLKLSFQVGRQVWYAK